MTVLRLLLVLVAIALIVETVIASRGWRGTASKVVGTAAERSAS